MSASSSTNKKKRKSVIIKPADKPKDWPHVLEIHTTSRVYRLFSDEYDVKEQWFYALDKFLLHRAHLEEEQRLKIQQNIRNASCQPANNQGEILVTDRNDELNTEIVAVPSKRMQSGNFVELNAKPNFLIDA